VELVKVPLVTNVQQHGLDPCIVDHAQQFGGGDLYSAIVQQGHLFGFHHFPPVCVFRLADDQAQHRQRNQSGGGRNGPVRSFPGSFATHGGFNFLRAPEHQQRHDHYRHHHDSVVHAEQFRQRETAHVGTFEEHGEIADRFAEEEYPGQRAQHEEHAVDLAGRHRHQ
jgi:hypothetical protein